MNKEQTLIKNGPAPIYQRNIKHLLNSTIGPSDYRTCGLSNPWTIGPSNYRNFGLLGRHRFPYCKYMNGKVFHAKCVYFCQLKLHFRTPNFKTVIHISINEGILINVLRKQTEGEKIYFVIYMYIWTTLRNSSTERFFFGVAKSYTQRNKT
jgi:hypothetical protein